MPWIGAIASVGGALISSGAQSKSAGKAADTQAAASENSTNELRRQFDLTRGDQAPFRTAGVSAIGRLQALLGLGGGGTPGTDGSTDASGRVFDKAGWDDAQRLWNAQDANGTYWQRLGAAPEASNFYTIGQPVAPEDVGSLNKKFSVSDFWADPVVQLGYQSGLDLGTKALKNSAPLTTGLDSGAALKELTKFGTDYSGMKAGESQQRYIGDQTNQYNRLAGIAGIGQTATQATGQAAMSTGSNIAGIIGAQGNAKAASQIAQGNAWAGGLNSISNWWSQKNMLDRLSPQKTPQATGTGGSGDWNYGNAYDF